MIVYCFRHSPWTYTPSGFRGLDRFDIPSPALTLGAAAHINAFQMRHASPPPVPPLPHVFSSGAAVLSPSTNTTTPDWVMSSG